MPSPLLSSTGPWGGLCGNIRPKPWGSAVKKSRRSESSAEYGCSARFAVAEVTSWCSSPLLQNRSFLWHLSHSEPSHHMGNGQRATKGTGHLGGPGREGTEKSVDAPISCRFSAFLAAE